jgi:hypothetical protein
MVTSRKRSVQIKVTLTPEMHAQLADVSRQFGQAPATLCSVWIGQAVAQQARNLGAADRAVEELAKQVGPEISEQIRIASGKEATK